MFTELNDPLGVPFKFHQLDALSRNFCNLLTHRYSSFDFGFADRRKFLFQFDEPTSNLIRSRNFFFNSTSFFTRGQWRKEDIFNNRRLVADIRCPGMNACQGDRCFCQ